MPITRNPVIPRVNPGFDSGRFGGLGRLAVKADKHARSQQFAKSSRRAGFVQAAFDATHGAACQASGAEWRAALFGLVPETVLRDFGGVVSGHVSEGFPCTHLPVHPPVNAPRSVHRGCASLILNVYPGDGQLRTL